MGIKDTKNYAITLDFLMKCYLDGFAHALRLVTQQKEFLKDHGGAVNSSYIAAHESIEDLLYTTGVKLKENLLKEESED